MPRGFPYVHFNDAFTEDTEVPFPSVQSLEPRRQCQQRHRVTLTIAGQEGELKSSESVRLVMATVASAGVLDVTDVSVPGSR